MPSVAVRPDDRGDGSTEAVESGSPDNPVPAEYVGNRSEREARKDELAGHIGTPIVMTICAEITGSIGVIAMSLHRVSILRRSFPAHS